MVVRLLRSVVRNDAMKSDPPEIYNWRVFALVGASCFGGMLFGWDTGAIGGVLAMEATQARYGYTPEAKVTLDQNIVSTLQAGCFLACFFTSWLTEKFGRRWCLIGTGTVTTIGVIFQAASTANGSLAVMYVGRFVAGLGVGAASTLVPLYVSECAPRAIRGGLTSFYQLFIVTGVMLSFWINYGALLHLKAPTVYALPLALQALPAVLLICGMLLAPESPRWCARKDDWERATALLVKLRGLPEHSDYVQTEIQEMSAQLEAERRLTGDASASTLWKEMATIPGNRKRAILSVMLMVCQQMTGVNAVNYYAPQIFQALGMTGTTVSLFATGVYGIVKVVGCALFLVFCADSLGRRRSLLWTSCAQAVTMYIIGIYGRVEPPVKGQDVSLWLGVEATRSANKGCRSRLSDMSLSSVSTYSYQRLPVRLGTLLLDSRLRDPDCPSSSLERCHRRSHAVAVQLYHRTNCSHHAKDHGSGGSQQGMFFMFGSFGVLMGLFVWFFIPETKGLSLEQMDELFGVVEMTKKLDSENPEMGRTRTTSIREERADIKELKQ